MSSALNNAPQGGSPATFSGPVQQLIADLLHAMGQPLTALQLCRLATALPQRDDDRLRDMLPELADQVDHVTDLYRALRSLFEAEATISYTGSLPLRSVLQKLQPEWRRQAAQHGVEVQIEIASSVSGLSPGGLLHPGRIPAALCQLFNAILLSVPPQGALRIHSVVGGGTELLSITGGCTQDWQAKTIGLSHRIATALLEQEGIHLLCSDSPMEAILRMPRRAGPTS